MIKNEEKKIYEAVALLDGDLVTLKQNSPLLSPLKEPSKVYDHQVTLLMSGIKNMGYYAG